MIERNGYFMVWVKERRRYLRATPCAVCGHQYSVHVPGLRCYGLRCKCTEFCDPFESRSS